MTSHQQQEMQEWTGSYWEPSLLPLYQLRESTAIPRELLQARDVPAEDWLGHPPRVWERPRVVRILGNPSPSAGQPEVRPAPVERQDRDT